MEKRQRFALRPEYIALQLAIPFGLLILIVVGMGWLGLSRMGSVYRDLETTVGKRWAKVETSRKAFNLSDINNRLTMEVFFLDDQTEIQQLLARRAQNSEKIRALINELEVLGIDSGKERELIEAIKATRAPYVASYKQALALLLKEKKPVKARITMVRETLPLLNAYHDAWSAFVDFQRNQLDQFAAQSRTDYQSARGIMLGLLGISALIFIGISVFVTRAIAREILSREMAEKEIVQLNGELEEKVILRTRELSAANHELESEIEIRKRIHAGRQFHDPDAWRNGFGSHHFDAHCQNDGGPALGGQRTGTGQHLSFYGGFPTIAGLASSLRTGGT
jgi:hypothetical protein